MTVGEIVNAYCESRGLKVIKGRLGENDPAPILPFLIMDCAYSEFNTGIKPLKLHHELKRMRKAWLTDYHLFNKRLFSALDQEQTNFTIDMMDEYEALISNDVMVMRVALMNLVKGLEFDDQGIIASLMLCNIFAQVAQIAWSEVFRNNYGKKERNPELERLKTLSHKLTNAVVLIPEYIDPNQDKALGHAVESYMSKTTKYLNSYDRKR